LGAERGAKVHLGHLIQFLRSAFGHELLGGGIDRGAFDVAAEG